MAGPGIWPSLDLAHPTVRAVRAWRDDTLARRVPARAGQPTSPP